MLVPERLFLTKAYKRFKEFPYSQKIFMIILILAFAGIIPTLRHMFDKVSKLEKIALEKNPNYIWPDIWDLH